MDEQEVKAACARLTAGSLTGTGYLVSPDRLATCEHVVRAVGTTRVKVRFEGADVDLEAEVEKVDPHTDSALLKLLSPVTERIPLELAENFRGRAEWFGFGYPVPARGAVLPITGTVLDARSTTDEGKPSLTLRSPEAAAGMATPLSGFSGTPVLVAGMVVGHLSRVISDPENPGRPAYGIVYATRAEAVAALLGKQPRGAVTNAQRVTLLGDLVPPLPQGRYHALISYRSTDLEVARALTARLEGRGLRVFLAEKDLQPGARLANELDSALKSSAAGIILMSQEWFESPWCQEEGNAIKTRAVEDPTFRLVPVRLDSAEVSPFLAGRVYVDLRGREMTGKEADSIVAAVLGVNVNKLSPSSKRIDADLSASVDEALERIEHLKMSSALGGVAIQEAVRVWRAAGLPMSAVSVVAAELLIGCGKRQEALEVLAEAPDSLRKRQLQAHAHARNGELDEAQMILEALRAEGHVDPETSGLIGSQMRRRWLKSGETRYLLSAFEAYREAYERTGDSYPGINVASLALEVKPELGGGREVTRTIAMQIIASVGARNATSLDHWGLATLGEAYLLLEQFGEALKWYGKAVVSAGEKLGDLGSMRAQARRNLRALGKEPSLLDDVFGSLRVAVFSGHLTDDSGRAVPRFPESKVAAAKAEIKRRLQELHIRQGFGSAARGADLLFVESLRERSGTIDVYLPFRTEDFVRISVGASWMKRFSDAIRPPRVQLHERIEPAPPAAELAPAFDRCNEEIAEAAIRFGYQVEEAPILIALWNGEPGDSGGGTSSAIEGWKQRGLPWTAIDLSKV